MKPEPCACGCGKNTRRVIRALPTAHLDDAREAGSAFGLWDFVCCAAGHEKDLDGYVHPKDLKEAGL